MRVLSLLVAVVTLSACAPAVTTPLCPHAGMTETRLYFGLSEPSGRAVTDQMFKEFVTREVSPRIPQGFTIQQGRGYWKDEASGKTISEESRVLLHMHQSTAESSAALDAIADAYKARFHQDAVMRTDTQACVEFR